MGPPQGASAEALSKVQEPILRQAAGPEARTEAPDTLTGDGRTRPTEIVRRGYGALAVKYHAQRDLRVHRRELDALVQSLPKGGKVLDAGCGSGKVAAHLLRRGLAVTGIDISKAMLSLAATVAPAARLTVMDMRRLRFPAASFDGVIALYSVIHVPRRDHLLILRGFRRVLRPRGSLLIVMGREDIAADRDKFLGTPMYWSHFGEDRNLELLAEAGFVLRWSRIVGPPGDRHLWALASAP